MISLSEPGIYRNYFYLYAMAIVENPLINFTNYSLDHFI